MSKRNIIKNYRDDAISNFKSYKKLAERAIGQVSDEEFFRTIDAEANSIALIVKHLAGNIRSRWTDFLDSDGEKADRNRDTEFVVLGDSREGLMAFWEASWETLFQTLDGLKVKHFGRKVTIRGQEHTVAEAINRQMTHYAYHIGQIVFLAKHFRSAEWQSLSIPKNRSGEFNSFLDAKKQAGEELPERFDAAAEFIAADGEVL
ncbi:MAG: DUF1572 family protein [Pyrinomonadaceae bacterium]|nr:DUF1572 family protein [Pyrinomonadaceae bacterium]